ncbi:MAG: hypothetical protein PHO61_04320, partial [Candidatus ainarchaeum sp.]|nr:hypothetical protein [Candidatus ainarchaeum sp.]
NKPSGYSTDEEYLNLEENKWAQIKWIEEGFVPGKIIVGVKVKIRQTALQEERIDLGYRAWGVIDGDYERDPFDNELGTSENKSGKQALYALTKPDYITVGIETLCDATTEDRSFCITSTYTDQDGFTHSFNDSFDALNNTPYTVSINVMNNSLIGFDNAKIMLDNTEENIMLNSYIIKTPRNETKNAELNTFQTEWIDVSGFNKGLSIDIMDLKITPQKTGSGSLLLRIREQNELIFEKTFTINISSDKKMNLTYLNDGEFKNEVPKIISGKFQLLTIKAKNAANNLEIENAIVKVFDRFGTKIFNTNTNALGVAIIEIPASFPGEKLKIKVEKPEYETLEKEIEIAKDVVTITPTELNFTVNPQTNKSDSKTVKITNQTGLDLTIKEIKLGGKLKGVLSESQIESWFDQYIGKKILSQDYEEIEFKVISSDYVKIATDLEAIFQVTLSAEGKTWTQEINAKIRVGLGKDVDNQSCLQITPTSWNTQTRGNTIELGAELVNNCTVDSKPVQLKNLGLKLDSKGSIAGDFVGIYKTAQVEISPAYSKTLKPTITPGEKIPLLLRFTPLAGTGGTATGTIIFEAENNTDSSPQKITTGIEFNIEYENLQDCLSLGTGLVTIDEGQSGTFAVINNCKFNSDIQIDNGDLQAALSDKTFTLKAGESKEIQVTAQLGQMPGAYNMLVHARQPGTNFELLDNVKIIVNPINSCFTLTRYEYDVYDSEFNNFDGIDRGYLKNSCVQKTVSANVSGIVPFDNWQSILTSALIGGIAGGARSKKFAPDWISALWSDDGKNNSEKIANSKAELQSRLSKDAIDSTKSVQGVGKQVDSRIKEQDLKLDKMISDVDKSKEMLKKYYDSEKKCAAEYTASMAKLDAIKKEALTNKSKLKTDTTSLEKRLDSIIEDIKKNQENASRKVQEKSIQLKEKVDKGEMGAELAAFEFSMLSDDLINEGSENSSSREKEYAELAKELQKIVAESEKELEKNRKELFDSVVDCSNCFKKEGVVSVVE